MSDRPADELPPELRAFLYSCTDSIEQVELLVHLHAGQRRPRPGRLRRSSA